MSHGLSLVRGTSYQSREALSKVSNCFLKATLDLGKFPNLSVAHFLTYVRRVINNTMIMMISNTYPFLCPTSRVPFHFICWQPLHKILNSRRSVALSPESSSGLSLCLLFGVIRFPR